MTLHIVLVLLLCVSSLAMAQVPADVKLEKPDHPAVKLTTEKGEMIIELFPDLAPKHVESFLSLIKKGYYNGLTFHRVEPGFVIQGGCPKGNGTGGPGYTLPAEFSSRKHVLGILSMARTSDPNSAGSQFFICLGEAPHLDNSYTVFGNVVKGLDIPPKVTKGNTMKMEILQDLPAAK